MNKTEKFNQLVWADHYSVFDKNGNKICDTSSIDDAMMMSSFDVGRTYKKIKILLDQIVNIPFVKLEDDKQLNPQKILQENTDIPFNPL
jgi:hypothetical protein